MQVWLVTVPTPQFLPRTNYKPCCMQTILVYFLYFKLFFKIVNRWQNISDLNEYGIFKYIFFLIVNFIYGVFTPFYVYLYIFFFKLNFEWIDLTFISSIHIYFYLLMYYLTSFLLSLLLNVHRHFLVYFNLSRNGR